MTLNSLLNRISRNSILYLFIALPLLVHAEADLKINELMPKNVSYSMDKSYITQTYKKVVGGVLNSADNFSSQWVKSNVWTNTKNYSMWVEVYNSTGSSKTLSNYYFTDDLSKPTKWKPLSINGAVANNGYSVLYFEREDEFPYTSFTVNDTLYILNRQGHADFKLDPDGGKLYLLNASKTVVDSVVYPPQYRNISYGRQSDGDISWKFFELPTPGASNTGYATLRCTNPQFTLRNGFYASSQTLKFAKPALGETIYYTSNGKEPTTSSTRYVENASITLNTGVHKIRAKVFSTGKLSSDVVTNTYFIGQRSFNNLPVVSIVTDSLNFYGKEYGIYYSSNNPGIGLPGRGQSSASNVNQDWDRPVNFEFFDKNGQPQLNQEVEVKILGGWSRHFSATQKSLAISPKDKFGVDRLNYDFFGSKPGHQYKDIQLRNSGNDNVSQNGSMMLDGLILSISANRMDVDYLAYEPAVLFINGKYIGIQNIRERSNADFIFSNYGYASDDVEIIEGVGPTLETKNDMKTDPAFNQLVQFLKNYDVTKPEIYRQVCDSIDVDEFINYLIPQIYSANTDWPDNNVKMWRKKKGGKWRWILYDTDFGFKTSNASFNALAFALGEGGSSASSSSAPLPEWSYIIFRRLCANSEFLNKLVDRFAIHMSTTYEPTRVNRIIDSLVNRIDEEFPAVKNFPSGWKSFAANRNKTVLNQIAVRFFGYPETQITPLDVLSIDANIAGASYTLNNNPILDKKVSLNYFKLRTYSLKANKVKGYTFDHWAYTEDTTLLPFKQEWKYYYYTDLPLKNGVPSNEWKNPDYDDTAWNVDTASFGHVAYGDTHIPWSILYTSGKKIGQDSIYFYTAYFRKKFTLTDLANKNGFRMNLDLHGGAVVYINGVEVGRAIMPTGPITYKTTLTTLFIGLTTINIPKSALREGENTIAVEVHKYYQRHMRFDLQLNYQLDLTSTEPVHTSTMFGSKTIVAHYIPSTEPEIDKDIVINEVVSDNREVMDEYGEREDYIELYNKGTEPIDIGGWYITDAPANKLYYQIPTDSASLTTIEPGGRLILWADDDPSQGVLHLDNLKLSKDGETLILSRKLEDNTVAIIDSVSFPVLGTQSYSRVPDGSATWAIQGLTFNASNTPTGILSPETSSIALFPTQVTESFTVRNAEGLMLSVVDLTGKVLKRERCTSNETVIQTGDLKRGMYLVMVGEKTFKVIRR